MRHPVTTFLSWGRTLFAAETHWCRVPFQPILAVVLWASALRIIITDGLPPYRVNILIGEPGEHIWAGTAVAAPLMLGSAWWLIRKCRWQKSTLAGMWIRFGADVAMFAVLLTYHLANVLTMPHELRQETVLSRYLTAAILVFQMLVIVRDVWALILVERLAKTIEADQGE